MLTYHLTIQNPATLRAVHFFGNEVDGDGIFYLARRCNDWHGYAVTVTRCSHPCLETEHIYERFIEIPHLIRWVNRELGDITKEAPDASNNQ